MRPRVRASFGITGDDLDLGAITESLGVAPTEVYRKEDARAVIKEMGLAADTWEYTIPRAECASVSERLGTLRRALGDGAGRLAPALEGRDADVGVELSVHAVIGDEPDLTLTRGDLAFLGSMGAELGIDPYLYYPDEADDLPPVDKGA